MARKAVTSGGTREEILNTAKRLFFEKGFDGVTIRTIQREVGCEVGLFYYYFKSKEQVFDKVMDETEAEWKSVFDKKLQDAEGGRVVRLETVFDCLCSISMDFLKGGAEKLHWSVKGAAYNRLAALAEEYIAEILGRDETAVSVDNKSLAAIIAGGFARVVESCSERELDRAKEKLGEFFSSLLGDVEKEQSSARRQDISVVLL